MKSQGTGTNQCTCFFFFFSKGSRCVGQRFYSGFLTVTVIVEGLLDYDQA